VPAPFASDPARSRGRLHPVPPNALRDAFQRDRDRIVHCEAFRRLRHKTQVFVAPNHDHYRVRLTHSLEVAQIARTIARALELNEDLTEAVALAHDLGHPPFGHAGEAALDLCLAAHGGWDHNGHTLRVVSRLERPYPLFDGLNLTWEMLEGLAKHNGPVAAPGWALAREDAGLPLSLGSWPGLEAQVAALCDDVAYDMHDVDDGFRAGLLSLDQVLAQPFLADAHAQARRRFPTAPEARLWGEMIRIGITAMVDDLLAETRARLAELAPASVGDVRAAGRATAAFSSAMAADERALKDWLYANVYRHEAIARVTGPARELAGALFAAYRADPAAMPPDWAAAATPDEPARSRHVADYVAGQTDRFAIREYRRLVGPSPIPDDLF
jgi:dGTPase